MQYDLSLQSGLASAAKAAHLGSRNVDQSALLISVAGDARDTEFSVLVDDAVRGTVQVGHRLALFVPAYRTYRIRLVPKASSPISFDGAERDVTLYPGNVRTLAWTAQSYFTVFGQATALNGKPISHALVETAQGIAETDATGNFQVDMRRGDAVTISTNGTVCHVAVGDIVVKNDFASMGKVACR
jgi:hypothetical protein